MLYDMRWDEEKTSGLFDSVAKNKTAGNLGQVSMASPDNLFQTGRFLYWTEDNRMHAAVDDRYTSYYAYDHSGGSCASREQSQACLSYAEMEQRRRSQRRLKLTGDNKLLDVNADIMATYTLMSEPTLYPSAYMVLTNRGYTKHYYTGAERVAARMGGGGLDALYHVIGTDNTIQAKTNLLFDQSLEQVNHRVLEENDQNCIMLNEFAREEFGHRIDDDPSRMQAGVELNHDQFRDMVNSMLDDINHGQENEVYFYHSDHLGSASWITNFGGVAVQHIQYLPYGEPYINQHPFGYSERFTFTGKEKDEETGYGYFGARYMDHELMTMWLSVDPLADKYPSISPYAYCAWNRPTGGHEHRLIKSNLVNNPVKLVDPDGREWDPSSLEIVNDYRKQLNNKLENAQTQDERKEIQAAINELFVLDKSNQVYHIEYGEVSGHNKKGETCYDLNNDYVKMTIAYDGNVADIAHEMKHAYQFEVGGLSFNSITGGFGVLYDLTDERAAYNRSGSLGGVRMTDYAISHNTKIKNEFGGHHFPFLSQDEVDARYGNNGNFGQNRKSNRNADNSPYLGRDIYRKNGITITRNH